MYRYMIEVWSAGVQVGWIGRGGITHFAKDKRTYLTRARATRSRDWWAKGSPGMEFYVTVNA